MTTTPPSLLALQAALQTHILEGHPGISAHVLDATSTTEAPALERLGIYREGYRLRLLEVMRDHFAHTLTYLGEALFDGEALGYIESHPSASPSLRLYGEHWPQWLAQRYPDDLDMADLAQLEWALRHAFDCSDVAPVTLADLAHIPPEAWDTLGFDLAPGVQVLALSHQVIELWHALAHDEVPPPVVAQPLTVLVWRMGWQPHFRSLGADEARALKALGQGQPFARVCAGASGLDEQAQAQQAGQWLQQWIRDQLLVWPQGQQPLTASAPPHRPASPPGSHAPPAAG